MVGEAIAGRKHSRTAIEFREKQEFLLRRCQEAIADAQERMRNVYNSGRQEQTFEVGDKVYLSTKNLNNEHTGLPNSSKLGPKWIGPYSVVRRVHNHAYELNLPPKVRLHRVFNTGSLKPYAAKSRPSKPHEVILQDRSIGQIVESITNKRVRKGQVQYLVQWEGEATPTWEPLEHLSQVTGLIQAYESKPKKRKRRKVQ